MPLKKKAISKILRKRKYEVIFEGQIRVVVVIVVLIISTLNLLVSVRCASRETVSDKLQSPVVKASNRHNIPFNPQGSKHPATT